MARVTYDPIDSTLIAMLTEDMTPTAQSSFIADFAHNEFLKADRANAAALGRQIQSEVYVDGARGGNIYRVRPNGTIVYEWDLANDVVQWIWEQIHKHSPVLSGRFRESHRLYADGTELQSFDANVSAEEWVITTVVPYARKLEGTTTKKYMSAQAPDGIYQVVAALASARYGNIARVRFTYRAPSGGGTMLDDWAHGNAMKKPTRNKQRAQYARNIRQPAISITFR
jgi:hypothetical protein